VCVQLRAVFKLCGVTHVLHLAAQAGVRYAVKNPAAYASSHTHTHTCARLLRFLAPSHRTLLTRHWSRIAACSPLRSYVHSNVAGFVTLLEVLKDQAPLPTLVFASSSSIYGLNDKVPFAEADMTDRPASLYAATKKSNELLAHTYAHIYGLSATGLRYFTVYGPWGRPDMAAYAFTRCILAGKPVRIFQGPGGSELSRDFTYVDDIVAGTLAALHGAPRSGKPAKAPRMYNLGNTRPVNVSHFVSVLEAQLRTDAVRQYVTVPATGDVLHTNADISRAAAELGYAPEVPLEVGLARFADWFVAHYGGGAHARDLDHVPIRRALHAASGRDVAEASAEEEGAGWEGWGGEDAQSEEEESSDADPWLADGG
jgi:UDP-glucuronate 4-epimerase